MAKTLNTCANALSFHSTTFGIVDHQGLPWLKANEIAQALGYADESAINRIYARRSDEFTNAMTCSVKLTDQTQTREVRIFSLRGAHLLAMFARTAVAKEFRVWVLDVLEQQNSRQTQPQAQRAANAHKLATKATAQVFDTVFQAAMRDGFHPTLDRLLINIAPTDDARAQVTQLERNAIVTTIPHLIRAVASDMHISTADLTMLALACTQRLASRTPAATQGRLQI